ncbi:hypothetical protein ACFL0H_05990 [Thermodesulfobacteriota bacterium]
MSANTGTISLNLTVNDNGSISVRKFAKESEREVSKLSNSFINKLGGGFKKIGSLSAKAFGSIKNNLLSLKTALIGVAVYGLARVISGWEKLSETQEKAEAGMKQAMMSMSRYTDVFYKGILDVASSLQGMSTFGDEAILMGTKFLMTYKNISDEAMPRVMKTMTNLAALMKGDFVSAANMLGKASMGMTGELRRVGITVDEDVYKAQGFIGILGQIEEQVNGQAEALRNTKSGIIDAFGNVWGDITEKLGLFTSSIKALVATYLMPQLKALDSWLWEWINSGEMEDWVQAIGKFFISWLEKIGMASKKAVYYMIEHWGDFLDAVNKVVSAINTIYNTYKSIDSFVNKTAYNATSGRVGYAVVDNETRKQVDRVFEDMPPDGRKILPSDSSLYAPNAGGVEDAPGGGTYTIETVGGNTATYNFNQQISRSDIVNFIAEQERRTNRG